MFLLVLLLVNYFTWSRREERTHSSSFFLWRSSLSSSRSQNIHSLLSLLLCNKVCACYIHTSSKHIEMLSVLCTCTLLYVKQIFREFTIHTTRFYTFFLFPFCVHNYIALHFNTTNFSQTKKANFVHPISTKPTITQQTNSIPIPTQKNTKRASFM